MPIWCSNKQEINGKMSLLNCVNNKTKPPNKEKTPNKSFNKKSLRLELGVPINKAKSKKKVPKK